jgi:hypothetical protein
MQWLLPPQHLLEVQVVAPFVSILLICWWSCCFDLGRTHGGIEKNAQNMFLYIESNSIY